MSRAKMINEITNNIINAMGTLICHNIKWIAKLSENMII